MALSEVIRQLSNILWKKLDFTNVKGVINDVILDVDIFPRVIAARITVVPPIRRFQLDFEDYWLKFKLAPSSFVLFRREMNQTAQSRKFRFQTRWTKSYGKIQMSSIFCRRFFGFL